MRLRFARSAERDFETIGDEIASQDPAAAARLIVGLRSRCRRLARFPLSCPEAEPPAPPGVRRLVAGVYVVLYRPEPGGTLVLRVIHGARDLGPILSQLAEQVTAPEND